MSSWQQSSWEGKEKTVGDGLRKEEQGVICIWITSDKLDVRKIQAGRKILQPKPHPRRANPQLQSLIGAMSRWIGASREAPLPWERLFPGERLFPRERPAPSAPGHPSAMDGSVLGRAACSFFLNILSLLSRRKASLFYGKSTNFPQSASSAHTKAGRWGSEGDVPTAGTWAVTEGRHKTKGCLQQNGLDRRKPLQFNGNLTDVWPQTLLVCLEMLQPLYIDFPLEYASKEVRGHWPLVLLP